MIVSSPRSASALLFAVEDGVWGFPLADVTEVIRAAWPLTLPRAPYGCLGVLDVRGELVPVVDLAAALALRRPLSLSADASKLLDAHLLVIARPDGVQLACLVSRVLEIAALEPLGEGDRQTAHGLGSAAQWVIGGAAGAGQRALVIDPWGLLSNSRVRMLRRAAERATEERA